MSFYIYIRNNELFDLYDLYKLGVCISLYQRDFTYLTTEIHAGEMIYVIKVIKMGKYKNIKKIIDNYLKYELNEYNVLYSGGTEFYKKEIINLIEPLLSKIPNLEYEVLDNEKIQLEIKLNRIKCLEKAKKYISNLNIKKFIEKLKNYYIKPNDYQKNILNNIQNFYLENNIGQLLWACGLGKALMSLFIVQSMNFNNICIGVPNKNLQRQFVNEIQRLYRNDKNINIICINKDNKKVNFLLNKVNFVITTYNSCHKLLKYNFDFKIGDECHHLVNIEETSNKHRSWIQFHNIKSQKTLFMTATIKNLDEKCNGFTMNDEKQFGNIIDKKTFKWAIENKKITDYNVIVLQNTEKDIDNIIYTNNIRLKNGELIKDITDKEIFLSCYITLKCLFNSSYTDISHLLLYYNTKEQCEIATYFINTLIELNFYDIEKINNFYYNHLTSDNSKQEIENGLSYFKSSKYGIINCVYLFGEGFDLPKINAVCFGSNMSSEIRITQYCMRANRLDKESVNKIAYYIIPYIDSYNWRILEEKKSFDKVKNVISQIAEIDDMIEQKLKITIDDEKLEDKLDNTIDDFNDTNTNVIESYNELKQIIITDLDKLKFKLKHSKSLGHKSFTKYDEYNLYRVINQELNINSIEKYREFDETLYNEYSIHKGYNVSYLKEPKKYFYYDEGLENHIWKGFYHFCNIDTCHFIQSTIELKKFCKEHNIYSQTYTNNTSIYKQLPYYPEEFYLKFDISLELPSNNTKYRKIRI